MIDFETCKFVVWGYRNAYHTHGHIHEGFYRTLVGMGKEVRWLDQRENLSQIDFSNTFFITEHEAAKRKMPIREDCFYLVHGANNDPEVQGMLKYGNWLGWNVFLTNPPGYDSTQNKETWNYSPAGGPIVWMDDDVPFWPDARRMDFRWATDMLPSEIEANKPGRILGSDSKVINWIGSVWFVNDKELAEFNRACVENGISFNTIGAGQKGVVSVDENVRLVRASYMAPAISGSHHNVEGYAPCRIFKNISYGQPGITNNPYVNRIFKETPLIFETDPYKLFYVARERLQSLTVEELHRQMDYVARKHTYVNRINAAIAASKLMMKG